jgi:hypothetical protein
MLKVVLELKACLVNRGTCFNEVQSYNSPIPHPRKSLANNLIFHSLNLLKHTIILYTLITEKGIRIGIITYQNANLYISRRALEWKLLVYFMSISSSLRTLGIFHGHF